MRPPHRRCRATAHRAWREAGTIEPRKGLSQAAAQCLELRVLRIDRLANVAGIKGDSAEPKRRRLRNFSRQSNRVVEHGKSGTMHLEHQLDVHLNLPREVDVR